MENVNSKNQQNHWLFQIGEGPLLDILSRLNLQDFASLAQVGTQFRGITSYAFTDMGGGKIPLDPTKTGVFYKVIWRCKNVMFHSAIIRDPRSERRNYSSYLISAILKNEPELVKIFLKDPSTNPRHPDVFRTACQNGFLEVVKILLEDGRAPTFAGLDVACKYGHVEVVKRLLEDSNCKPSNFGNLALKSACKEGRLEVVRILLRDPRLNLSNDDRIEAIQEASSGKHDTIVELLQADQRVDSHTNKNRSA